MFKSFIQAGFECSTQRNRQGQRLDLLRSTGHDICAEKDYRRVQELGIETIRIGARWHLIEHARHSYCFDSLESHLEAAQRTGTEVILDLLHFGWPDHVEVFSRSFPYEFGNFTFALIQFLKSRNYGVKFLAPVNEVSYLSWAGGEVAALNPHTKGRGAELKRNLIRAAVHACEILRNELPGVVLISPEPVIHIVGDPAIPGDEEEAANYSLAQFESWDMLSGRVAPELGGRPEFIDVLGVNFYERNEWLHNSGPLTRDDPRYRPFSEILQELWRKYRRPLFVSETGAEGDSRADWFTYICNQVEIAVDSGVPVHGICLYPILNHPGWDDNRHCCNGLFDYLNEDGARSIYKPLASAILTQQERFAPKVPTYQ